MTSLKTLLNWKASFKCKVEKEVTSGKVVKVKCVICAKYESQIKSIKGFSTSWITGTLSVKKESLEKHLSGKQYKKAKDLATKELLGPEKYQREVVSTSVIGQGIKKMNEMDKEVSFFACYYVKNSRSFYYFLLKNDRKTTLCKMTRITCNRQITSWEFPNYMWLDSKRKFLFLTTISWTSHLM